MNSVPTLIQDFTDTGHTGSFSQWHAAELAEQKAIAAADAAKAAAQAVKDSAAKLAQIQAAHERRLALAGIAFREYWAYWDVKYETAAHNENAYRRNQYAWARGYLPKNLIRSAYWEATHNPYANALCKAIRELHDRSFHAKFDPSGTTWLQRRNILKATPFTDDVIAAPYVCIKHSLGADDVT